MKRMESPENLLQIENLRTSYHTINGVIKAIDSIDVKIPKQKAVGIVGESGCGKSTVAMTVMGLIPNPPGRIEEGQILYKGKDLVKLSEKEMMQIRGNEISMVFQDPLTFLNPVFKVGNQIKETILRHQPDKKKEVNKMIIELLNKVGIPAPEEVMHYYPHQLSGGMRQRILIAISLACNPTLVIMDEPTTALDVTIQRQIIELIKSLIEETDMSLMLITHDLGVVAEICDIVYVMYAGKILEHGEIYKLFDNPVHPYTKGLLESALSIDEFKKELVSLEGNVPDMINLPSGCRYHPRCPQKTSMCSIKEPPLSEIEPDHFARCWQKEDET
jgi:peptide/nickel transport system ATP-binding protein/oligopeptide transport system ATP-binding protein